MSRLRLTGVSKRYGNFLAVDDIALDLQSGEFVSLLGPSGCGKTTTLRMIAGFVDPSLGTIEMDGQILSSPAGSVPPDRRQMSMIFQSYAIWPNMTVEQNVAFGLELRKIAKAEVRRRVGEMLEVVHMNHLADRYPAELSGGQQQRVALARAIVIRPSVLLLDEPLSNLDATLREEMRFEIRRLHDEFHVTTVYVTHDQAEAMVTSDRIAVMNHGRIEQVDNPRALYDKPKTRFVAGFIGRTNFIEGLSDGHEIAFDGFALAARRVRTGRALGRQGGVFGAAAQHAAFGKPAGRRLCFGRRRRGGACVPRRTLGLCGAAARRRLPAAGHGLADGRYSGRRQRLAQVRTTPDGADCVIPPNSR